MSKLSPSRHIVELREARGAERRDQIDREIEDPGPHPEGCAFC
jgi:hypothetical protein